MFTEDVHLGLMPIGGRTEKHKEFAVSLQGSEDECEKTRGLIGEIGRYDTHDLAEMVCDAVEEMARHLAWEGCAVYEIVLDDDGAPHVWSFTSKGLWRLPRWFLQVIPRGDWDLWKRKWTVVPASRIWYVDMPSILGGRTGYRRVLKRLGRFEPLGPQFWRKDLERGQQSKNFDFQGYVRQSEIYFDRITKAWGWNRRDWSQERSTEFFNVYKMVNFRWAQAVLREHMIAALNSLFARLGITCEVKVKGLPTVDDILNTKREFLDGRISFGAASGRVML
ncbi:MAG: hypothetical protein A3F74_07055 [Betaproteobacteria bacterium RIFCSPLOWO2_12_FULL_62_58]|nr:MAG: hypothetical protein A3F74_07055 [Betaproteobacteria bacterium RIFCSPLOWO2_12_FULL_62_58]